MNLHTLKLYSLTKAILIEQQPVGCFAHLVDLQAFVVVCEMQP